MGQIIISVGILRKSWELIFLGRFVFGVGGESFVVANTAFMTEWFKGKELALAFGVNMAVSKLGSVWNNLFSPFLADSAGIAASFCFGVLLCLSSSLCVQLANFCNQRPEHSDCPGDYEELSASSVHEPAPAGDGDGDGVELREFSTSLELQDGDGRSAQQVRDRRPDRSLTEGGREQSERRRAVSFGELLSFRLNFWLLLGICFVTYGCLFPFNNVAASFLLERDYFRPLPAACALERPLQCQAADNRPNGHCPASSAYRAPLPLNFSAAAVDCGRDSWREGCTAEYCRRFTAAAYRANSAMSIPYAISALLSPPVGYFVDQRGLRASLSIVASASLLAVHLALGLTDVSPELPLVGQGVAYTFFSAVLWSSVPIVVEEHVVGFAFGIVTCVQNLGSALVPLLVAAIYEASGRRYRPYVELLFAGLGGLGMVASLSLSYDDFLRGNPLNKGLKD